MTEVTMSGYKISGGAGAFGEESNFIGCRQLLIFTWKSQNAYNMYLLQGDSLDVYNVEV
jgi:hypothetical protein